MLLLKHLPQNLKDEQICSLFKNKFKLILVKNAFYNTDKFLEINIEKA